MEQAFDVIMRLFRGETVTEKTDWFTCDEAVLQMRPYSDFDVVVASSISPSGSKLAGRYGTGMLSIAATEPAWVPGARLQLQGLAGGGGPPRHTSPTVQQWRLMGPMHIAETVEQAKKNCRVRAAVGVRVPQPHHPHRRPDGAAAARTTTTSSTS
jgi:limonene 1,2-monooxygenase